MHLELEIGLGLELWSVSEKVSVEPWDFGADLWLNPLGVAGLVHLDYAYSFFPSKTEDDPADDTFLAIKGLPRLFAGSETLSMCATKYVHPSRVWYLTLTRPACRGITVNRTSSHINEGSQTYIYIYTWEALGRSL